jgi:hypothetical protein
MARDWGTNPRSSIVLMSEEVIAERTVYLLEVHRAIGQDNELKGLSQGDFLLLEALLGRGGSGERSGRCRLGSDVGKHGGEGGKNRPSRRTIVVMPSKF